jgi:hypothetical protein
MNQWSIWGSLSFEDDCDECFKGGINFRINQQDQVISLPTQIADVQLSIPCVE